MTNRPSLSAAIAAAVLCAWVPAAAAQAQTPAPAPSVPDAQAPADVSPAAPAPYTPPAPAPAAPSDPAAAGTPAPGAETPAASVPAATPAAPAMPADDAPLAAATGLTPLIEDVQVVGPWTDGGKSGVWRTIMMQVGTSEKETYRFFIQQIEKAGATQTVLATTEIKEIPGIDGAIVGYRADEPTEGETSGLTLFFDIVPSDGEIAETYELHFRKDQPYSFGPATN